MYEFSLKSLIEKGIFGEMIRLGNTSIKTIFYSSSLITILSIAQAEKDKFSSLNTEVLTVVVDPAATIKSTIETYKITSPVLIDDNKKVSTDYEVLNMNSSMHMGQKPGHTFVLIGSDNKIKWVGDYPEMNASTNEILEKVKASLQG